MINAQVAAQARDVGRNNIINISSRLSRPAILSAFIRRWFYLWISQHILEGSMGEKLDHICQDNGDFADALKNFNSFTNSTLAAPRSPGSRPSSRRSGR